MKKIVWICSNCGKKYGNKPVGIATWHEDVCDICGKKTIVTEPRDFGGLKQSKETPVEHISRKMYPTGHNVNEELFDWACSELEILEDNQKKQVLRDVISQSYKKAREEGRREGIEEGTFTKEELQRIRHLFMYGSAKTTVGDVELEYNMREKIDRLLGYLP